MQYPYIYNSISIWDCYTSVLRSVRCVRSKISHSPWLWSNKLCVHDCRFLPFATTILYDFLFCSYRCGTGTQGISMNCGDRYGSHLDCQWIDVTGVPLGRYILRQTVNPDRLALESDYENNIAECTVDMVPWYSSTLIQVVKDSCRLSGNSLSTCSHACSHFMIVLSV